MNGRRLYREYAKSQGVEAKEFVKIESDYQVDILITKGSQGNIERTVINYKDMMNWVIKNIPHKFED